MRVSTRSKFCSTFSKVCQSLRCELRHTTNRHGRFPSMAKRIQLLSLISSLKKLRKIQICEPFNSTWLLLVFCQMIMRNSGWRGSRDDASLVSTDESTRACACVGRGGHCICVAKSFYFGLDFRCACQRTKANRDPQGHVVRTGSLRERTRPLDKTRRMDPSASTNAEGSSRSFRAP